jgi:glycosyltransferase involved in cell wall biosynthesis
MARVCVIRQGFFPFDTRVRREVEALLAAGHEVDVICLARTGEPRRDEYRGATVRRLPVRQRRGGLLRYMTEYGVFLLAAGLAAGALHLRRRYQLIQVHSMPDVLVFAALVPRLLGARVLLDLHECMPEFFATKYRVDMSHPGARFLAWLEQRSIHFADMVITCTEQMRDAFVARGAPRDKIGVVMNSADETIFNPAEHPPKPREPDRFVLICHGSIEERYGLDTVIEAISLLREEIPGLALDIYGEGSYRPTLERLADDRGLGDRIHFSNGYVQLGELLDAIAAADAGVVAMKRDAFRDLTHCNKMFDFIAMRRPALVSRTRSVEAYFDESCFQLFTADDEHDLARAIRELHADPMLAEALVERAAQANDPYRWERQREVYLGIVEAVLAGHAPSANGTDRARQATR